MTIHINPAIRGREDALETAGLIQPVVSDAISTQKVLESTGVSVRPTLYKTFLFGNVTVTK